VQKIPLWRKVSGSNKYPHSLRFEIVDYALVDDWRYDELNQWKWCRNISSGGTGQHYAFRVVNPIIDGRRKTIAVFMHVVVAGYKKPDHINGNGLDNQEHNLRPATHSQNHMNQGLRRSSTSGFKGVSPHKGKWQATIKKDGVVYRLGLFEDKLEAARSYDKKAKELFGSFARLNFP
jgi:hypothetical protein